MAATWEIGWGGEQRFGGSEPTKPDALRAAEEAASGQAELWQRPGAYVRVVGPNGGIWVLRPVRQKPGRIAWQSAGRRSRLAPKAVRSIAGIDIPALLAELGRRRRPGSKERPDPVCSAAVVVIRALGGASA